MENNNQNVEKNEKEEMMKKESKEIQINSKYGNTLDSAIKTLQDYKEKGENVVIEFNGHKIYSYNITEDVAYQELFKKTKSEYEEYIEQMRLKREEEQKIKEEKIKVKIPEYIEKGKKYIYPEREAEWEKTVKTRMNDLYNGIDLENAMEIMDKLENGATINETKEYLDSLSTSGSSSSIIRSIVFQFSKKGPDFFEKTASMEITPELKELIQKRRIENEELEIKNSAKDETVSDRIKLENSLYNNAKRKKELTDELSDINKEIDANKKENINLKKNEDNSKEER